MARIDRLEKRMQAAKPMASVEYKDGQKADVSLEKAIEGMKSGVVYQVTMPETFNEQEARYARGMSFLRDAFEGLTRDYQNGVKDPEPCEQLIFASKPVIMARQDVPEGRMGCYFRTDDGERFHQSEYRELCKRRGAGIIIIQDYDRTKEPWYRKENNT